MVGDRHCGVGVVLEEATSERRTDRGENGTIHVMVCVWDGKEFPGMRQNEKRIEFVRTGDDVRAAGQLRESTSFVRQLPTFIALRQNSCCNDGMRWLVRMW